VLGAVIEVPENGIGYTAIMYTLNIFSHELIFPLFPMSGGTRRNAENLVSEIKFTFFFPYDFVDKLNKGK
jgi:hypothetical protein